MLENSFTYETERKPVKLRLIRQRILDVYVLALGVLSVIMVVAIFLGMQVKHSEAGAEWLLFTGLVVIALSAGGGWWLKQVAAKEGS